MAYVPPTVFNENAPPAATAAVMNAMFASLGTYADAQSAIVLGVANDAKGNLYTTGAASGDTTGAADTAAIQAKLNAAESAGGGVVRAHAGQTYWVASAGSTNVQYPAGGALAGRLRALSIPSGVTLDMNGSTLKLAGSGDTMIVGNKNLDASTRNTDLGLINAVIDNNNVTHTLQGSLQFSFVDRLRLENVKMVNSHIIGGWVYAATDSYFDKISCDGGIGQGWAFGDPQAGAGNANQVYTSYFGSLRGRNMTRLNTGAQPGNPFYMVLTGCAISSIMGYNCSAGLKFGNPGRDTVIGLAMAYLMGDATTLNSGVKLQGTSTYGGAAVFTGNTTSGTNTITSASSIAGLVVGTPITGPNIPANTYITAAASTTVTLSANATGTASTQTFTQTETRYIERYMIGLALGRDNLNQGLYLLNDLDSEVVAYRGYGNVTSHTANSDVYLGGSVNPRIGSIITRNSYGGGVRVTQDASGVGVTNARFGDVKIINPGQNPSNAIKSGFRMDVNGSIHVDSIEAIDDQASHTMNIGVDITNSGNTGQIDSITVSGQTGSAISNASAGLITNSLIREGDSRLTNTRTPSAASITPAMLVGNPSIGSGNVPIWNGSAWADGGAPGGTTATRSKVYVDVATGVSGTLATSFANGQSVDSVTLTTGMRILIKNQATMADNGIYTVNASGAPTRALDLDAWNAEVVGAEVYVSQGGTNARTTWRNMNVSGGTLGTTAMRWTRIDRADRGNWDTTWLPSGALFEHPNKAESMTTSLATGLTGVVMMWAGPVIPAGTTLSSMTMFATVAPVTPTHYWAGFARTDRVVLATSADQTTGAWTVNTWKTFTFGAAVTFDIDTPIYFFYMMTAGTMAKLLGGPNGYWTGAQMTVNGANARLGTSSTGQTTAPTAGSTTFAAITAGNGIDATPYCYVSGT